MNAHPRYLFKLLLALLGCVCSHFACSRQLSLQYSGGGGTETVIGKIVLEDGKGAPRTQVRLLPNNFNPVSGTLAQAKSALDTTNDSGNYLFDRVDSGTYAIMAVNIDSRKSLFLQNLHISDSGATISTDTLHKPGSLAITLPSAMNAFGGYMYIPGTTLYCQLAPGVSLAVLDSVPAATLTALYYVGKNGQSQPYKIAGNVRVTSQSATTLLIVPGNFSKHIDVNTSASGAQIFETLYNFPALIRLNVDNFNFSQADKNGKDIRFTKQDSIPLDFEIEQWDSAGGSALIWVKIDTIVPNANQSITMYWGNPYGASVSAASRVFDTSNGFQGVWHLGDKADTIKDATVNNYFGVRSPSSIASYAPGIIGFAQVFGGVSDYIEMPNTATGKLDFMQHGSYTLSAWVYTEALDSTYYMIATKGNKQYGLKIKSSRDWEFTEYEDTVGWDQTVWQAVSGVWVYLAGVRENDRQYLYVNGACVDSTIDTLGWQHTLETNGLRNSAANFTIGSKLDNPSYFFHGKIDEVQASNIARSPNWIRLCYLNQQSTSTLVQINKN